MIRTCLESNDDTLSVQTQVNNFDQTCIQILDSEQRLYIKTMQIMGYDGTFKKLDELDAINFHIHAPNTIIRIKGS